MNTISKLKYTPIVLLFILPIFFNAGCGSSGFGQQADSLFLVDHVADTYYDLKRPKEKYFLPYVLSEISGLTYRAPNSLLAVDDETGKIFEYSLKERDIIHSIEFAPTSDYEGVEIIDNKVYVLRSDGDLFIFEYTSEKKFKSEKLENKLSKKNDTEGLGYLPSRNQLLVACKEKSGLGDKKLKGRSVYAFDLEDHKLIEEPLFTITKSDLANFWKKHKEREYLEDRIKFKPSAIAYNPFDNNLYMLSSIGKLMVVLNEEGTIQATYPIPPRILGQPEGLTFAPNGDMYISSEGEGDRGYILKFPLLNR